jgi:RND superfamily putative drug exporter
MAAGMMLAVALVLLAALTLLPALLGHGINRWGLPWHNAGEHRSPRWGHFAEAVQRRPALLAAGVVAGIIILASPLVALKTGMPSITVLPKDEPARVGYDLLAEAFGPGGPGPLQIVVPADGDAQAVYEAVTQQPGIAAAFPPQPGANGSSLLIAMATTDPSSDASTELIATLRSALPATTLVGGPVAENHDLDQTLRDRAPLVIGTVLVLGFILLLVALQSVVIAAIGVVLNLFSVAAAFGVGALAFQHGWLAPIMGFESQGYLTSWAPLFFFTLVFAISMDYTVFLLASAREHFERSHDPSEAVIGSVSHTGRPIVAAAGIMVAVFFTFALFGPLPMKEMGIILGVAVLIDALAIRLVLVPALLTILGRAAWWMPRWADRLLPDVKFAH